MKTRRGKGRVSQPLQSFGVESASFPGGAQQEEATWGGAVRASLVLIRR